MVEIGVVTCHRPPHPPADQPVLLAALERRGLKAVVVPWDSSEAQWQDFGVCLLQSPWDYHWRSEAFQRWLAEVSARTRLINPLASVRWNLHKGYLRELLANGLAIVPTEVLSRGCDPALALSRIGRDPVVIKPAVGAGGRGVLAGRGDDLIAPARRAATEEDLVLQPFIEGVYQGERSLIYLDGDLSHAVIKRPRACEYRTNVRYGGQAAPYLPSAEECALSREVLAACPGQPVYARIDIIPGPRGPLVSEVELIEPALYLSTCPASADALAAALTARLPPWRADAGPQSGNEGF